MNLNLRNFCIIVCLLAGYSDISYSQSVSATILKGKIIVAGNESIFRWYFLDNKECEYREIIVEQVVDGIKKQSVNKALRKDNFIFSLNDFGKYATKNPFIWDSWDVDNMWFGRFSETERTEKQCKKMSKESVLGSKCDKYILKSDNFYGIYWVTGAYTLKSEIQQSGIEIQFIVDEILTNQSVNANMFEIPSDYQIIVPKPNKMNDFD